MYLMSVGLTLVAFLDNFIVFYTMMSPSATDHTTLKATLFTLLVTSIHVGFLVCSLTHSLLTT